VGDYEDFNCNSIRRQISPEWRGNKKKKKPRKDKKIKREKKQKRNGRALTSSKLYFLIFLWAKLRD